MQVEVQTGENSRKFEALAEGSESGDVCEIHPPPVQAADDTSDRTSAAVPGEGLPFPKRRSSDAAEELTEVKKSEEETGGKDEEINYVVSQGGNGNGVINKGGLRYRVPKSLIVLLLALIMLILLVAVPTITIGLASPGGNETKHNAYLGDTIRLFSVREWYWLESVLVKGEPALHDGKEVKLFSVACDSVKGYTKLSHIEPGHSFTDVAAPFPILDHHLQDISNYFATASGNMTVNMTVWSKELTELSLCYFDYYESYESFIQRLPKAKEKALNCTEYQTTAEPKTVISEYSPTHPGYYFIAIAANSPFSLQYTVDMWHEELNQSDYVAENCSIIGDGSCEITFFNTDAPELCILAYYLTGLEDFVTLHAETEHRFSNNAVLIVGCVFSFILIISVISCVCYIIHSYCKFAKRNGYHKLRRR